MLVAAEDAATIVTRGRVLFDSDRILQRAAKNLVAELGEAAKAVPDDVARQVPGVPWRAVKGMREKVVLDCPEVDLDVLWTTLADEPASRRCRCRTQRPPSGVAICRTISNMPTLTIRTDSAVERALALLTGEGMSRSEAARSAILQAERTHRRDRLRAEAEALRADERDVAASRELAAEMEALRAW